ncbi:hypothetical protein EGY05_22715 [Chryseobacterium arthrosphaerae]|nr:hypothetical protein EGY05_22715 [Chryseobacterium arthrosphaerae]
MFFGLILKTDFIVKTGKTENSCLNRRLLSLYKKTDSLTISLLSFYFVTWIDKIQDLQRLFCRKTDKGLSFHLRKVGYQSLNFDKPQLITFHIDKKKTDHTDRSFLCISVISP